MKQTIPSIEYLRGAIDAIINNFEVNNYKFDAELGLVYNIENRYDNDLPFTESTIIGYKIVFVYIVGVKELDHNDVESIITQDGFSIDLSTPLTNLADRVEGCLERASQVKLEL